MNTVARPPLWRVWLLAIRPATLTVGWAPVVAGLAIAHALGGIELLPALAAWVASTAVQIGSNLANDYFDFVKGADNDDRIGPARATQQGWLTPRQILSGTVGVLAIGLLAGAYLATVGGWPVVAIALASVICAVAYTGGPVPLAYVGLGDVFVLTFFGPVAVMGTIYVQHLTWPPEGLVAGLALGLPATGVLVVNNLRDRHGDAKVGKRTLAVRFGAAAARAEYAVCILGAYALVLGWWAQGGALGWLAPLLSLPVGLRQVRAIYTTDGPALNPELGTTARFLLLFAVLLAGGLATGV